MASNNSNNSHTIDVVYRAWCAKNSLLKPVELKNPLHLALWKVTCATFTVHGHAIQRAVLSIEQHGANSAFLSLEKSLQLQLDDSMTATMIKRFQSTEASTDLTLDFPSPLPAVSVVIEPEFVQKCNENQHSLNVQLFLQNGDTATTNIAMQIYSKHSGTRSKLLLNPKEKNVSSSNKKRSPRKSPKKQSRTTRSVTVTEPLQKSRFLNARRNASVPDDSDGEYNDGSSDEEFVLQPLKTTHTRVLRERRGELLSARTRRSQKNNDDNNSAEKEKLVVVSPKVEQHEEASRSPLNEGVSCLTQANSPQTRGDEEITGTNSLDITDYERAYHHLIKDELFMDVNDLYYGLDEGLAL